MPTVRPGFREMSTRTVRYDAVRDTNLRAPQRPMPSRLDSMRRTGASRTQEHATTVREAADPPSRLGASLRGGSSAIAQVLPFKIGHLDAIRPFHFRPYEAIVSPTLSRGSQPTAEQISALKAKGFRSIVNFRIEDNSDEATTKALKMGYLHVLLVDDKVPTYPQVVAFLDFVGDPKNQPAFSHCTAGAGRTGIMVAAYRMAVQGWAPAEAINEALKYQLHVPAQEAFLIQFARDLAANKIPGYPKV